MQIQNSSRNNNPLTRRVSINENSDYNSAAKGGKIKTRKLITIHLCVYKSLLLNNNIFY